MLDRSLSVIIPLYNEEKRLNIAFAEILRFNSLSLFSQTEYIFVNDGSIDQSVVLINQFISTHPEIKAKLISYNPNLGKGNAVKTGMLAGTGDYLLMADTDMSTPLSDVAKFFPAIESGVKVVIGSRKSADSNLTKKQSWLRRQVGNIYTLISQLITGLWQVNDFGCGFKLFEKEAAKTIFTRVQTPGWVFDVEALLLAKKMKYPIKQIGVTWHNDEDSRVKLNVGSFKMLIDLIKIRF
jgi:dolichyl-phosphate beta-glucosyltransferase